TLFARLLTRVVYVDKSPDLEESRISTIPLNPRLHQGAADRVVPKAPWTVGCDQPRHLCVDANALGIRHRAFALPIELVEFSIAKARNVGIACCRAIKVEKNGVGRRRELTQHPHLELSSLRHFV